MGGMGRRFPNTGFYSRGLLLIVHSVGWAACFSAFTYVRSFYFVIYPFTVGLLCRLLFGDSITILTLINTLIKYIRFNL